VIRRSLLRFARTSAGGSLVRFALRRFPWLLPFERVPTRPGWIAFRHPAPSYPIHILIVPLPPMSGLNGLTPAEAGRLAAVFPAAFEIAGRLQLAQGWRLVVNGGRYQEVRLLHFHLLSGKNQISSALPGGAG
jgi:histidine triad (HIT) family protein